MLILKNALPQDCVGGKLQITYYVVSSLYRNLEFYML